MKHRFEYLTYGDFKEIQKLADSLELKEDIDYACDFIGAFDTDGHLNGLVGINFEKCKYPRFEHILIDKKYQKTALTIALMFESERYITEVGYTQYVAFIYRTNSIMTRYAKKFGFEFYCPGNIGDWYIKTIKERKHALVTA